MIGSIKTRPFEVQERFFDFSEIVSQKDRTLILESKERLDLAIEALLNGTDYCASYHAFSSMVIGAKAFLQSKHIYKNTHFGIIRSFEQYFNGISDSTKSNALRNSFQLPMINNRPKRDAQHYVSKAKKFNEQLERFI